MKPSDDAQEQGPWGTGIYGWLQAVCCLLAAALAIASYSPGSGLLALTTRVTTVQAELEVVNVNDELDPLATADEAALPVGVTKLSELTQDANGESRRRLYARLVLQGKESFQEALQRLRPWQPTLTLPATARFAWQAEQADAEALAAPRDGARDLVPAPNVSAATSCRA